MTGHLYIVSAPSGAGKTTLVHRLLEIYPDICLSISSTTRPPRAGEEDGQEYHFIDEAKFKDMLEKNEFLEWAKVHDNYYGTSKSWTQTKIDAGKDVLLEIDCQGAQQIRRHFPNTVSIFVMPPSIEILHERLKNRQTDSAEVIKRRIAKAYEEIRHANEFNYVIINDDLEEALTDLVSIIRTSRLQFASQRKKYPALFEVSL